MWVADGSRAVIVAALALLVVRGDVAVAQLCAVAFLLGAGQTLFDNAGHAILPDLVPRAGLMTANGRLASARTVMLSFVGPPVGTAIFAVSPPAPFVVDAATFVLAAVAVAVFIRSPGKGSARDQPRRRFWADVGEGMRWVARDSVLRPVAVLIAIVNFTQAATQGILVLYALQQLGPDQGTYGLLLMASGVGGTVGGLLIGRIRRVLSPGTLFAAAILVTAPIFTIMAVTSSPWVAGLMLMLNAFAGVSAGVLLQTVRQAIVPGNLLARVNSNMQLIGVGVGLPSGSIIGGLLASTFGLRAPFVIAAALIAATAVAVPPVSRALNRLGQAGDTTTAAHETCPGAGGDPALDDQGNRPPRR